MTAKKELYRVFFDLHGQELWANVDATSQTEAEKAGREIIKSALIFKRSEIVKPATPKGGYGGKR